MTRRSVGMTMSDFKLVLRGLLRPICRHEVVFNTTTEEAIRWLDEQGINLFCRSEVIVGSKWVVNQKHRLVTHRLAVEMIKVPAMRFHRESDAILFKLRWG